MALLSVNDLTPFADIESPKAHEMIDDATALAVLAAPCLDGDLTPAQAAGAKAILRGAILRWFEAGTGALQSETVGPFGQVYDTRQQRKSLFWPSEIEQLQRICDGQNRGGAFSIDQVPAPTTASLADRPDLWFQWL